MPVNFQPLAIAAFGCMALFLAVWIALTPKGSASALGRIARAYDEPPAIEPVDATTSSAADAVRSHLQQAIGHRLERSKGGSKLAVELARADVKLRAAEWLLLSGAVSVIIGALLVLRFGSVIMAPVGLAMGWFGCNLFLRFRQRRRRKAFDKQLAPTILSLSSAIKAGYTFGQAIDLVAKNTEPPMSTELARVTREVQLGVPMSDALDRMVNRNDSEDMRLMVTAVQIQTQVGGKLSEILDTIEYTIRERIRIKGEIKTITSQARVSGWILIALPFGLGGILSVVAPSYFTPMLHQTLGQIMLGMSGFCLACGYGFIRKIVNIEV